MNGLKEVFEKFGVTCLAAARMYFPNQSLRYFSPVKLYAEVNWADFREVVAGFKEQLEYWYILPTLELRGEGHFGFPVAAAACMLGDCLSQYESGETQSGKAIFKSYFKRHWPELGVPFQTPIHTTGKPIKDGADALYHGLRCGVMHEAHPALYVGLVGQATISNYHPQGLATYADTTPCPVVTFDPWRLFDAVHTRLQAYLVELLTPSVSFDSLRSNFKKKFESGFGVSVTTAL